MIQASERMGELAATATLPSFMEVMSSMKHQSNSGLEGCCECARD